LPAHKNFKINYQRFKKREGDFIVKKLLASAFFVFSIGVASAATAVASAETIEIATKAELGRLAEMLKSNDLVWTRVARVHVLLRDMADFKAFNAVYEQYLKEVGLTQFPARVTVASAANDAALISAEIDVVGNDLVLAPVVVQGAPAPVGPFSPACVAEQNGQRIFFASGQLPRQADGSMATDPLEATMLALQANDVLLKAANFNWSQVAEVTLYYPTSTVEVKQAIFDQVLLPYLKTARGSDELPIIAEIVVKSLPFGVPMEIEITAFS
jgi:enamine deaminase RidA (YjgF/YER057c/UK114 family)